MLLAIGITLVVFVLTQLVPSNAVATNLGEQAAADPAPVAAFKAHYPGLDKPLPVRYGLYLQRLVRVISDGFARPPTRSRTTSAS